MQTMIKILSTTEIKGWYGLKFSADENYLYASGGNDNWILQYAVTNNKLVLDSFNSERNGRRKLPAGREIDDARKKCM